MKTNYRLKITAPVWLRHFLAGCSSASGLSDTDATSETPAAATGQSSDTGIVPAVEVIDVNTEAPVNLGSVVPSDAPVLLWAWAPHCPSCRAEAPELEEFAAANTDKVTVVGLGTQDDLAYAKEFVADTGVTTPQMLWDPTFFTWQQLGITAQPTWILVDANGEQLGTWVGALPTEQILALV